MADEDLGTGYGGPSVVWVDPRIPTDTFMLADKHATQEPSMSASDVGKVFFARSPEWIQKHERERSIVLDGVPVANRRTERNHRIYSLYDVERMAHALAQNGIIDGQQLHQAMVVVRYMSYIWGYPA